MMGTATFLLPIAIVMVPTALLLLHLYERRGLSWRYWGQLSGFNRFIKAVAHPVWFATTLLLLVLIGHGCALLMF